MLVLLSFTACQSRDNTETINAINRSLDKSNEIIGKNNELVYSDLNDKSKDPCMKYKTQLWRPRALAVKALSDEVCQYIRGLKKKLDVIKKDDGRGIRDLFRKEGDSLLNKLARYSNLVTGTINPEDFNDNPSFKKYLIKDMESFKKDITNRLGIVSDSLLQYQVNNEQWKETYLNISSLQPGMAVLNKIQNDVLVTENELISYVNNQIGCNIGSFEVFHTIALLNSSYVKAGQPIEVTAGVGAFNVSSKPAITINGAVVKIDENGVAVHKLTTNQKPGKYQVSVRIEYTKPDGSTNIVTKNLEYTIAE